MKRKIIPETETPEERRERFRAYSRKWYYANPEVSKIWKKNHPEKVVEYVKKGNAKPRTKERKRKYARERGRKAKTIVLAHYGGTPPVCSCCGEKIYEFLCLHHINGGGNQQRKRLRLSSGSSFYLWIIRNKYPRGYQILCANCNLGKHILGHCPHQSLSRLSSSENSSSLR